MSLKAIDPLLRHTSLRTIELTVPLKIGLIDSDISTMADAWPLLEALNINLHSDWDMHPLITLNGVCYLLKRCPRLSLLAMPIHVMASDRQQPNWQLHGHALQRTTKGRGNLSECWQYQNSITKYIQEAQMIYAERGNIGACSWYELDKRLGALVDDKYAN
ncbi:hypothetical protein CONPUDRAFT_143381 [Coniophora puteana RWD-64-598 SS2]|uniref:F-box domain-containing protein n=1 Tax=Coniophora puteana (strain RWD-64-598) TaxID=741705 RepID=A0A5M3MWZ4_CONPW|nr:uncharacterized protein CONPUDRAFT_143381 [Coniophora puteana RWD-64-598 SS2]EIW83507.1 hypothetical protein CONPUDRAFT_143381 [Coniophora puteana RWD-64-598 SS2]